jgi:hypothetical protein
VPLPRKDLPSTAAASEWKWNRKHSPTARETATSTAAAAASTRGRPAAATCAAGPGTASRATCTAATGTASRATRAATTGTASHAARPAAACGGLRLEEAPIAVIHAGIVFFDQDAVTGACRIARRIGEGRSRQFEAIGAEHRRIDPATVGGRDATSLLAHVGGGRTLGIDLRRWHAHPGHAHPAARACGRSDAARGQRGQTGDLHGAQWTDHAAARHGHGRRCAAASAAPAAASLTRTSGGTGRARARNDRQRGRLGVVTAEQGSCSLSEREDGDRSIKEASVGVHLCLLSRDASIAPDTGSDPRRLSFSFLVSSIAAMLSRLGVRFRRHACGEVSQAPSTRAAGLCKDRTPFVYT